jgi:hypothetical protein
MDEIEHFQDRSFDDIAIAMRCSTPMQYSQKDLTSNLFESQHDSYEKDFELTIIED